MKKIHPTILPLLVAILLLAGCIHQHPDAPAAASPVSLDVELLPDREFTPLPPITKQQGSLVPPGCLPRVIVEARRPGQNTPSLRAVMLVSEEELANRTIILPATLNLRSEPYQLTVWVDYTRAESLADTYYNTENLRSVYYLLPYAEDHLQRDAFVGNVFVDLTGQEGHNTLQVPIARPLAHYRIVATDVQQFLSKQQANGRPGAGSYDVKVSYQYFLVTHLNALTGEPVYSASGFAYTRRIVLDATMTQCELAADYVLVGAQSSLVTTTIEVRAQGTEEPLLSRVVNLEIPYQRQHTTTVQGAFLTTNSSGGGGGGGGLDLGIDGSYDGEINIEIK